MSTIRQKLSRIEPLNVAYHLLRFRAISALCRVSPRLGGAWRYREAWGRWPDLENPSTFDEKLIWLNLYWHHKLKVECSDKFAVRGYLEGHGFAKLLPRMYGLYERVQDIDFAALPESFVLKCTHGSKCNVFCRDRSKLDISRTRQDLSRWLSIDFSKVLGELHYQAIKPRVICEEFIADGIGELPTDYKLYCFGGHFHCTEVCLGRVSNGNARSEYVDRNWKVLPYDRNNLVSTCEVPPPPRYEEMIEAAERLSTPFPFVRVDFYWAHGRVILGELTFTPSACVDGTHSELANRLLGELIRLPEKLSSNDAIPGRS